METLNTPVNDSITLAGDELRFGAEATGISIYDMAGKMVLNHEGNVANLNVSNLGKGVYVVKAQIGGTTATGKIYKY
jgi:hypothetical protein